MDKDDSKSNLFSLAESAEKKKQKAKQKEGQLELNSQQKQQIITEWLNGKETILGNVEPNCRYVMLAGKDRVKKVYSITAENELLAVGLSAINDTIGHGIHNNFCSFKSPEAPWGAEFDLTASAINACAKYWLTCTSPIEQVPMFGWHGTNNLVMRRIPFELQDGPTPVWDELLGRMTNQEAFMAFVGSILVENSDMQQYLWLHGQGGEGKGSISRFLTDVLGHLSRSENVPSPNDRFWTWGIKDARCVQFPDCNNTTFPASGLFKNLTGGESTRMEEKGGAVTSGLIRAKYIFLSNEKPDLSSERADTRRIIYCSFKKHGGEPNPNYNLLLWNEGPAFLYKCLEMYKTLCPNHGVIPTDDYEINEVISINEEPYSAWLHSYFFVNKAHECKPIDLQDLLNGQFKTKTERLACRNYLERQGIVKKARKVQGKVEYYYEGLRRRSLKINTFE